MLPKILMKLGPRTLLRTDFRTGFFYPWMMRPPTSSRKSLGGATPKRICWKKCRVCFFSCVRRTMNLDRQIWLLIMLVSLFGVVMVGLKVLQSVPPAFVITLHRMYSDGTPRENRDDGSFVCPVNSGLFLSTPYYRRTSYSILSNKGQNAQNYEHPRAFYYIRESRVGRIKFHLIIFKLTWLFSLWPRFILFSGT